MSKEYDEFLQEYYPKDLYIDMFSQYYGEDHKEFVKSRIESVPVVLVTSDILSLKLKQIFKEDYQIEGTKLLKDLKAIAKNESSKEAITNLVKNREIIKQLGFDVTKIVGKQKLTGKLVIMPTEETNRFISFIDPSKNIEAMKDLIDIDSIVDHYNVCCRDNTRYRFEVHIIDGTLRFDTIAINSEMHWNSDSKPILNLTDQDKEFLLDLILTKNNLSKNDSKYVLKSVNRIFNKEYKNINEILADHEAFFLVAHDVKTEISKVSKKVNSNTYCLIPQELNEQDYLDAFEYIRTTGYDGFYSLQYGEKKELIAILTDRDNKSIGSHEANHAISVNGKDLEIDCGLHGHYMGLNEIVNEFLNKRAIENYNNNPNNIEKIDDGGSGYDVGVKFMEKFLITYEDKFKESYLAGEANNTTSWGVLSKYFGFNNLHNLCIYAEKIRENNWGHFTRNFGANDIVNWIEEYKKHPEILNDIPAKYKDDIIDFIQFDRLLELLIERKQHFEKGDDSYIILEEYAFKEHGKSLSISEE